MGTILAIESSGPVCGLALVDAQTLETIEKRELREAHIHSKVLASWIKVFITQHGQPTMLAVSKGPGSYTGLRIGTSVAKGLAFGWDIPMAGVSTLESMAREYLSFNKVKQNALIQPMIDARRMEVFTQVFNSEGKAMSQIANIILEDLWEKPSEDWHPIGDGALKLHALDKFERIEISNKTWLSPVAIARIGLEKIEKEEMEDIHAFEPYYHKSFRAGSPKRFFEFLAGDRDSLS